MTAPTCRNPKCNNVAMKPGHVIAPTESDGVLDFPGDTEAITITFGGPGMMVPCWKCPECGRSIAMKEPSE